MPALPRIVSACPPYWRVTSCGSTALGTPAASAYILADPEVPLDEKDLLFEEDMRARRSGIRPARLRLASQQLVRQVSRRQCAAAQRRRRWVVNLWSRSRFFLLRLPSWRRVPVPAQGSLQVALRETMVV